MKRRRKHGRPRTGTTRSGSFFHARGQRSATERAPHLAAGHRAEAIAASYLQARGLRLIARNYRCRLGELDLVMQDNDQLVVVEVRYRHDILPVTPAASITLVKRERIYRTTELFLQQNSRLQDCAVRFDVVTVSGDLARPAIGWLPAAFDCSDRS